MIWIDKVSFGQITCYKCGIIFLVPVQWQAQRLEDHKTFYCPNGHNQYFSGKDEAQKLRDQKRRLLNERDEAWERAKHCRHRFNGLKGYVSRLKRQIGGSSE